VHVQHPGSDDAVWRDKPLGERMKAMQAAAIDMDNILERPKDISFAIDKVLEAAKDGKSPLFGLADPEKIGVAGHSFGAYTALASAGRLLVSSAGREVNLGDPRIKAAIAMSPQAIRGQDSKIDKSWGAIKIPTMHMTGTKDDSPIMLDTKAADRRQAYDRATSSERFLLILKDANHMIFSDSDFAGSTEKRNPEHQKAIKALSLAFWDAYLKGDKNRLSWLKGDGAGSVLSKEDVFEFKPAATTPLEGKPAGKKEETPEKKDSK